MFMWGVVCVGGRLQRSPISEDAKHQAILPKQHLVSDLIIHHYHLRCGHEYKLSMIRERYWIVQASLPTQRSEQMFPLEEDTGICGPTEDDYNRGQKCWEGSITLAITPSPLSMLDFPGRIWWFILHEEPHEQSQHWIWGGGGHKRMSFPK